MKGMKGRKNQHRNKDRIAEKEAIDESRENKKRYKRKI